VLPKLLDLMVDRGLDCVTRDEAQRWPANVGEEQFARRGLHLDAKVDAVDHRGGFIVHRERAGKCLAKLDRPE
jgi:hypothetical protein